MTAIKAKRPLRSLLQAKNNFVSSIRVGIDELMTRAGYSRQRATDTLLRELGRGGEIPTDQEIFHLMEHQGLGMDEASQALVVSKAVRRAMREEGLSALEAIDDLVQRLSVSNLLASASASPEKVARHDNKQPQHEEGSITSLPRVHSGTMLAQRRTRSNVKPIPLKPSKPEPQKQKNQSQRKRSISEEKVTKEGRARADSVAEEVNAKLDTRPKGKRDVAAVVAPPPAKRPREI